VVTEFADLRHTTDKDRDQYQILVWYFEWWATSQRFAQMKIDSLGSAWQKVYYPQ